MKWILIIIVAGQQPFTVPMESAKLCEIATAKFSDGGLYPEAKYYCLQTTGEPTKDSLEFLKKYYEFNRR